MTAARSYLGRSVAPVAAPSWWTAVVPAAADRPASVVVVQSDRYPDRARVELTANHPALVDWVGRAELDARGGVRRVELAPHIAPRSPQLWFLEVRETARRPPAINLVAFHNAAVPFGTVVSGTEFGSLPVADSDQLGSARWYPATLEVDQVYVQPACRRRGVGTALVFAAGVIAIARGWPRPWADGQRTELGELFRNGSVWRHLAADLTRLAPPLTPRG